MESIKQDLNVLYNCAISSIFKEKAKAHVYENMQFLSNEEFKDNEHSITKITSAYRRVQEHLNKK